MPFHHFGRSQRVNKAVILFFGKRAVDVVRRAFAVTRRHVDLAHVDGIGFNDGADGIVKEKMIAAGEARDLKRERI